MINFKQKQLADEFFKKVRQRFPEIELIDISPSPEDPRELWINITSPPDEYREFELMDMVSEISADILSDYGYPILVHSTTPLAIGASIGVTANSPPTSGSPRSVTGTNSAACMP